MQNVFFALLSFSAFTAINLIALFQDISTGLGPYAGFKDVGMSAAFIGTCVFMFRYFTGVIEKKEQREKELIHLFLKFVAEHVTHSGKIGEEHTKQLLEKLDELHMTKP